MVMADLFQRECLRPVIAVAHCNFHLRGVESDSDEALVRRWCAQNSVRLFVKDFDTAAFAASEGVSIEMAARQLRYEWFDALCREEGFDGVCVAHNADDNAETLLLNLLRGTGLKGLCAMGQESVNPFGTSKVFRPLLGNSRLEIMEYARLHNVEFHTDSSNNECDFKRNKLRNKVFPLLKEINPSLVDTLTRDIRNFAQAQAIVDDFLEEATAGLSDSIPIAHLMENPHWRFILHYILSGRGFNSAVVGEVAGLLESDRVISGKRFESDEYVLVTTSSSLEIKQKNEGCIPSYSIELLDWSASMDPKTTHGVIVLDADRLGSEPRIRPWRDGDWLCPIGLAGKKKVSDMLTDLKYDICEKSAALVIESEGGDPSHVLALLGERIDRSVRVTPSTKRIYRISML